MKPAIRAERISKTFRIYDRPADRLKEALYFFKRKYHQAHTALYDISFEIEQGEFVGIIGKNGAGKSTLLKLLSGEMAATSGHIEVNGSVALLQLGVGFDPELSGIENARFAAMLMNFSEERIEKMLTDVAQFAEIGDFMHHPVKTYSSGMYSRLAFAIAVNVDPDILIADEVLAVGDIRFSQKCLRKMREFKERGKTVILVTHDVNTIGVFCDRAIWIKEGIVFEIGESRAVAENFSNFMLYDRLPGTNHKALQANANPTSSIADNEPWIDFSSANMIGGDKIRATKALLVNDETGQPATVLRGDTRLTLKVMIEALDDVHAPYCGWLLNDIKGLIALHLNTTICKTPVPDMKKGSNLILKFSFQIPNLNDGEFVFALAVGHDSQLDHRVHDILPIRIVNAAWKKGEQLGYVLVTEHKCEAIEGISAASSRSLEVTHGN